MNIILETIKSYLVNLGFQVDRASFSQANKSIDQFGKGVEDLAKTATGAFGEAAAAVVAFGAAVVAGTAKFLNGLGNQEVQMEILSRQLWTTQQQAQAFNATLQAMGTNLQSLYLSPTLMAQYKELHGVALQMQTPGDYNQQIQQVQSVQLQIKQMRLEAYYSLQWIGYYFIKYMSGPISKVHDVLQAINAVIVKNMPTWTKQVAQWMASFVQAAVYIVKGLGDVWNWLVKLLNYMPGWAKGIAAALAIFSVSNPFMLWTEAIGGLILLFDDFETYVHGGKAAFPELWAQVVKVTNAMKQMGDQTQFISTMQSLGTALKSVGSGLSSIWTGLSDLSNMVSGKNGDAMTNFFQSLWTYSISATNSIISMIRVFGDLLQVVGDLIQGKFGAAWKSAQDIWKSAGSLGVMPGMPSVSWIMGGTNGNTNTNITGSGSKGPAVGPPSYPYMFKNSGGTSTKHVTVHANQTNHIHSNSPHATNTAVHRGFNKNLHNIRGVIV